MSHSEDFQSYSWARRVSEALGTVTWTPDLMVVAHAVSRPCPNVLRLWCLLHFSLQLKDSLGTSLAGQGPRIHLAWGWICLSLECFSREPSLPSHSSPRGRSWPSAEMELQGLWSSVVPLADGPPRGAEGPRAPAPFSGCPGLTALRIFLEGNGGVHTLLAWRDSTLSAQTELGASRSALLSPHPQKASRPGPCRQAMNCDSDRHTLMYCGAEAWGFCLEKNKSLPLLSAAVMCVSEDLCSPGSPAQRRPGDSREGPTSSGTQESLCGLQTGWADFQQLHTQEEPSTTHTHLSTLWSLCPQCPFFPALLGELLFIVQCLALRALVLGTRPRLPFREILAYPFTGLFRGTSLTVLRGQI